MEGHLTKSASELDRTDELPVLTEEAILKFKLLEEQPITDQTEALEASIDTLRRAMDQAEDRWSSLEFKLETQDRAIAELRESLGRADASAGQSAPDVDEADREQSTIADVDANDDQADPDSALLERIASLESYIAGRADRWQEMEDELNTKARRIAELEIELEQRIAREHRLDERLYHEHDRSNDLRHKLRRMNRRLEEIELGSVDAELDATRELVGQAIGTAPVRFLNGCETTNSTVGPAPQLICLTPGVTQPFRISKNAITIGRGSDCDIQIVTEFVSRQHAIIRRDDSATIIEDHSSTNGVFVNARRIEKEKLSDGDEITIGESRFRFLDVEAAD